MVVKYLLSKAKQITAGTKTDINKNFDNITIPWCESIYKGATKAHKPNPATSLAELIPKHKTPIGAKIVDKKSGIIIKRGFFIILGVCNFGVQIS